MIIFGSLDVFQCMNLNHIHTDSGIVPFIDKLYNFNTLLENVPQLNYLNPYWNYPMVSTIDKEFDMWYVNYLGTTQMAFKQFMDIMRDAYNGDNVWILVDFSSEGSANITETLIKYILDIYGYVCNVVHTVDDLYNLVEGTFSAIGIQTFDANMEAYINTFGYKELPSDVD